VIRDIARALRIFASERYPTVVALPVALCACLGPYAVAGGGWSVLVRVVVTTFLVLFALRIVDDIVSVEEDEKTNPSRALPSGRVDIQMLARGAVALTGAALVCGFGWLSLGLAVLGLYYVGFFLCIRHVSVILKPWFVNIVFFAIPIQLSWIQGRHAGLFLCTFGVFFWLTAVGHDFAHSVHAPGESHGDTPSASEILGPRRAALVGLACYVGAFAAGATLAYGLPGYRPIPILFSLGLALMFVRVCVLLIELIAHPCVERARRLYVGGFAFLLVPSFLLWIDRVLGV